jgi:hypothetical protein
LVLLKIPACDTLFGLVYDISGCDQLLVVLLLVLMIGQVMLIILGWVR